MEQRIEHPVGPLQLAAGELADALQQCVAVALALGQDRQHEWGRRSRHQVLVDVHARPPMTRSMMHSSTRYRGGQRGSDAQSFRDCASSTCIACKRNCDARSCSREASASSPISSAVSASASSRSATFVAASTCVEFELRAGLRGCRRPSAAGPGAARRTGRSGRGSAGSRRASPRRRPTGASSRSAGSTSSPDVSRAAAVGSRPIAVSTASASLSTRSNTHFRTRLFSP